MYSTLNLLTTGIGGMATIRPTSVGYCFTMFSLRHLLHRILLMIALSARLHSYSLAIKSLDNKDGLLMNPLPTDSQIAWSQSIIGEFQ